MIRIRWVLFFLAAAAGSAAPGAGDDFSDHVEAITRPSSDVTLSFVRAGRIGKTLVTEGQRVKPGQVLVRQDDAAEQAQLAQLKAQARDDTRIRAAKAQLDQKKVDLKRLEEADVKGVTTKLEVEHARLDVVIAELSLELSRFQHEQDKRKCTEAVLHIERMQIKSPIAGKVEQLLVEVGESVDALKPVIRVVNIDPLRIDIPVPLRRARLLKCNRKVKVSFGKDSPGKVEGKIIHIASVADAASDTLLVRVEAPNPSGRPAGEKVDVFFTNVDENTAGIEPAENNNEKTEKEGVIHGKEG